MAKILLIIVVSGIVCTLTNYLCHQLGASSGDAFMATLAVGVVAALGTSVIWEGMS